MRSLISAEVFLLAMAAYIAAMWGLTLLIGDWSLAIIFATFAPTAFGAFSLADWITGSVARRR